MDDGDQVSLTHCGKSLWSMDDFDSTAVSEGDGEGIRQHCGVQKVNVNIWLK